MWPPPGLTEANAKALLVKDAALSIRLDTILDESLLSVSID
jgi:hypothetical protein